MTTSITSRATIHRLRIQNYRVLRDVEFQELTPLTVLLGPNGSGQAKYRDPDAITGGTWEALELVLQASGYHRGGLANVAAATDIAQHMNVDVNRSRSFQVFRDGVRRLVAGGSSAAQG